MLTKEENALLTQTGPGTPCGELLRRYWQPVAYAADLTPERPAKRVKLMHEELVLFLMPDGTYGCLGEHCAHRGASLAYGFVEECGLRCPYHGWKYDAEGRCLEQPFEPVGSTYKDRIHQTAYPVQRLAGVLFIYMGPRPAPLLPRWDVLAWEDGQRRLERQEVLECNWLQGMENTADITHTFFLHGYMLYQQGVRGRQVEQYYRPYERYGYQRFEWGVLKSWRYAGGSTELGPEHSAGAPLIFPNILRVVQPPWHTMHWRVPIDDTRTTIIWAGFQRGVAPASKAELEDPPIVDIPPQKHPDGTYKMDTFYSQDKMAWETQGPIMDRSAEHLGASDRGVVLYRQMLREQIEVVQQGGEPMCLIRDPAQNQCVELPELVAEADTEDLGARLSTTLSGRTMAEFVDERHEIFEVPFGTARWPEAERPR